MLTTVGLDTGSIDDNAFVLGGTTHTVRGVGSSVGDAGKPVLFLNPALDSDQLADLALVLDGTTYELSAAGTRTYAALAPGTAYVWTGTPSWATGATFEVAINSRAAVLGASPSTVATLSALTVTDADDAAVSIGTFAGGTLSYAGSVSTASVTVAATPSNSKARKVAVRSVGVVHADGVVELALGLNTVTVEVTAPDDTTKRTYTIALTRNDPADAALSALTLSLTDADGTPVELTPAFGPDVTAYTAMALAETVRVVPTARNASATFEVEVGGVGNYQNNELPLAEGANTVTVEVTAADKATTRTYTVTVTRLSEVWSTTVTAGSNNQGSGFINADVGSGSMGSMTDDDKRFTYLSVEYKVWMVGYATRCSSTRPQDCNRRAIYLAPIIPADAHPNWVLIMDGTVYDFADTPATPDVDTNNYFGYGYTWAGDPFTAGDTFDVAIGSKVPIPSSDATLSALSLTHGAQDTALTLTPVFAADETTYAADADANAAGHQVTLTAGANVITVAVTAEDGATTETYTVTVTRAEASAARLETLSVANAAGGAALTLTPVFAAGTTDYSASPAYPVSLVTLTATAASGTTVAFEDGAGAALTDADGATGFQAALVPGENVIKVKVTKSGASAHYTLTLTRAKAQVLITAASAPAAAEGAALVFRVSRRAAAADTLAVTVSVSEDGAMVDDALEAASTVTIAANQTSADLTVQTDADDAVWEEHSTVTARTEPGDLYVQAQPAEAAIEVRDDDFPAASADLVVAETVAEDAGTLDYAVLVVTGGDTQPHRSAILTVATRSGTAASGADFGFVSRELILPESSFVRLSSGVWISRTSLSATIVNDEVHEPDERFELLLERSPSTPARAGAWHGGGRHRHHPRRRHPDAFGEQREAGSRSRPEGRERRGGPGLHHRGQRGRLHPRLGGAVSAQRPGRRGADGEPAGRRRRQSQHDGAARADQSPDLRRRDQLLRRAGQHRADEGHDLLRGRERLGGLRPGHGRLRRRGLGQRGRLVHRGPGAGGAVGRVGRAVRRQERRRLGPGRGGGLHRTSP